MDKAALWQRYQDWLWYDAGLGIALDISRMRFDRSFVTSMQPKFERAFADMQALEGGAIANPDEGRMVGHYWLRAPELAPSDNLKQAIVSRIEKVKAFALQIHGGELCPPEAESFSDLISIGIGGSALGPEFVEQALAAVNPPLHTHFIDNTDPAGIDKVIASVGDRLKSTLVLVTSKSGGTPETYNGMMEVQLAFAARGLSFAPHAVAITGEGSKLHRKATSEGWLATFPMYDWIGGRTSELSVVGLLPAALQGIDIQGMLDGARAMDVLTRVPLINRNPAALLSMSWYYACNGKGEKDMVVLPYKDSLSLLSRYLQQLVMESLGKESDLDGNIVHQGIAVYGNKGSTDQHAYVQQLREGVPNFFATFIEVLVDRVGDSPEIEPGATAGDYLSGFLQGTRSALYENGRDSITITLPDVNPQVVGAILALYERAVSFYASLTNINAYHQPGVEAGKKAAASILTLQKQLVEALKSASGPLSLAKVAAAAGAPDDVEAAYIILRHLSANERGVVLEGDLGKPSTLRASWQNEG
ncbi:glucose-6-phosphate isomerase [Rubidibacter lacunae KORDI 51-2]|uniref:Glucose-6-phosphate isomerase n=1 Tax=Rubidibacter lacunae KORDI 51-2 TaxID=582515 RepID=U5DJN3_9CHRO|nr:glucose-6-phosphate isomerase [Rubidibacter lacunae]ERN39900.1 glucose-6-phosphate isomerase [Rubidibacter lacunae KORDI 51-2]